MFKTVSYDNKPLKFVSTNLKNQLTKALLNSPGDFKIDNRST